MTITKIQKGLVFTIISLGVFAAGCELIVDFDRTRIPIEVPETGASDAAPDSTTAPPDAAPDATTTDADAAPESDAGDGGDEDASDADAG